jgi:hypothetical protein
MLVLAARAGVEPLVEMLLKAGASSSRRLGHDALNVACEGGHVGVVRLLFASEHDRPTAEQVKKVIQHRVVGRGHGYSPVAELLVQQQALDSSGAAVLAF